MQHLLGAVVVLAAVFAFIGRRLSGRRPPLFVVPGLTPAARRAAVVALIAVAAVAALPALFPPLRKGIFALCGTCPVLPVSSGAPAAEAAAAAAPAAAAQGGLAGEFLLAAWYYAATVLPVFILASLLSGLLLARSDRFRVSGVWGSFGLAALLPVCSCGVVPLGRAIIERGGSGRRDGLIFLAAAPLLSPIIIVLSFAVLGPAYAILRIAASAVVAVSVALIVRPLLPEPSAEGRSDSGVQSDATARQGDGEDAGRAARRSDWEDAGRGALRNDGEARPEVPARSGGSALDAGMSTLSGLIRYALYGVVVGAAFTALLPAESVAAFLRPGVLSMAAAVLVGLPVNMCGGEEILISAPLVGMGLGVGHAVAFALASTGICVGSIPLLAAVLGRRAVVAMAATYVVVPFAIGLVLNALLAGGLPG
ncbi:MAG: permease [Candidatus Eisenbacteria bacterium]